ncbi:aldehyde dehydrogenase family protein, partial [Escherichia coli]
ISIGSAADVDVAAKAARKAFATWSLTSREERIGVLERIVVEYQKRYEDMAKATTEEMGAPSWLAQRAQAAMGLAHVQTAIGVLKN